MAEPITTSLAALAIAKFCGSVVVHVGYHEAHHLYREFLERWQEAAIDPKTGLPRNHDLQEASHQALREAALVLMMELAGRLDPKKPWLPRIIEHVREGKVFKVPIFDAGDNPQHKWLEALREAIESKSFGSLHDALVLNEDEVRHCFAGGDLCAALGPRVAERFLKWARQELQNCSGNEPSDFNVVVREGWFAGRGQPVTLAHVYCLFFREHLKRNPAVFRILVTDTLNEMRGKLDSLGASLTGELKALRERLDALPATSSKLDFSAFEQWLEPQLGEITNLLSGVATQLDAVARGQYELADKQGEILVAMTVLATEARRGNANAQAILDQIFNVVLDTKAGVEVLVDDAAEKNKTLGEIKSDTAAMRKAVTELTQQLAARGLKPADLSREELVRELASRVPNLEPEDLNRLISYALFKADITMRSGAAHWTGRTAGQHGPGLATATTMRP